MEKAKRKRAFKAEDTEVLESSVLKNILSHGLTWRFPAVITSTDSCFCQMDHSPSTSAGCTREGKRRRGEHERRVERVNPCSTRRESSLFLSHWETEERWNRVANALKLHLDEQRQWVSFFFFCDLSDLPYNPLPSPWEVRKGTFNFSFLTAQALSV